MVSSADEVPRNPTRLLRKHITVTERRSTRRTPARPGREYVTSTPKPKETETVTFVQSESRYYLRSHDVADHSGDEETHPRALTRRQLRTPQPKPQVAPAVKPKAPERMQLGYAEYVLAFLLFIIIAVMLWYYHNYYNLDK